MNYDLYIVEQNHPGGWRKKREKSIKARGCGLIVNIALQSKDCNARIVMLAVFFYATSSAAEQSGFH
jgi:hypothetical protein